MSDLRVSSTNTNAVQKPISTNLPDKQTVKQFSQSLHGRNKSERIARDSVANKFSKDALSKNTTVAETEKTPEIEKIFVNNLSSTGANRVSYSFVGGRHIQIQAKAGAAFGHEGFAYKVKSYEYNNGGHRIPHLELTNPTYGTFVVNTMNYGFGSTSYQKDHVSPVTSSYAQENFVQWTVTIPPQTSSNYNSSGFSLNVYQITD